MNAILDAVNERCEFSISPDERADLEAQAGYPFLSDEQAWRYRMRQLYYQAVDQMFTRPQLRGERTAPRH